MNCELEMIRKDGSPGIIKEVPVFDRWYRCKPGKTSVSVANVPVGARIRALHEQKPTALYTCTPACLVELCAITSV
jgi:hypothetical protein